MAEAEKIVGMKCLCATFVIGLLFFGSRHCFSQSFMNQNFEEASISGLSGGILPTASAFPDWSAYYGSPSDPTYSGSLSSVFYDGVSTGGASIDLLDSNAPSGGAPLPLQGSYSALLEGSIPAADTTASLGQTGTIPNTAQSLIFWAYGGGLDVSFDGQALSLMTISNTMNYTVYAANISAFAAETGQLLFTAPVNGGAELDNIQFSTSPVPEPGTLALCTLGGLSLALRRGRRALLFARHYEPKF
jgi:hypothetical protein